jgi:hypothetical protein
MNLRFHFFNGNNITTITKMKRILIYLSHEGVSGGITDKATA